LEGLVLIDSNTFFGALLQALQLGLEVNTPLGQAYLIPYWNKNLYGKGVGGFQCQFQMGYQGMLDLCYRFGKYKNIAAEIVYEGDVFEYQFGSRQYITHIPKGESGRKPTHAWARYELENGGEQFVVWTWSEIMKHAEQFSQSFDKDKAYASPWLSSDTSQESMAKKTVLKTLLKYAPKSVEIASASMSDENIVIARKHENGNESHLHFDVQHKQIEAPNQEERDLMDKINKGTSAQDKETAPVSNVNEQGRQAPATAEQQGQDAASESTKAENGGGLFRPDEDAALAELYERSHPAGPAFD
jgi:recombination protein RecT